MIRTPPGWGADMLTQAYQSVTSARPGWLLNPPGTVEVRRIGLADLKWALQRGVEDFAASRTDIAFLCIVYPLVGLLLARVAFGYDMLPLLFPLASGFALIGPPNPQQPSAREGRESSGLAKKMELMIGIEPMTSPLPRECSTN